MSTSRDSGEKKASLPLESGGNGQERNWSVEEFRDFISAFFIFEVRPLSGESAGNEQVLVALRLHTNEFTDENTQNEKKISKDIAMQFFNPSKPMELQIGVLFGKVFVPVRRVYVEDEELIARCKSPKHPQGQVSLSIQFPGVDIQDIRGGERISYTFVDGHRAKLANWMISLASPKPPLVGSDVDLAKSDGYVKDEVKKTPDQRVKKTPDQENEFPGNESRLILSGSHEDAQQAPVLMEGVTGEVPAQSFDSRSGEQEPTEHVSFSNRGWTRGYKKFEFKGSSARYIEGVYTDPHKKLVVLLLGDAQERIRYAKQLQVFRGDIQSDIISLAQRPCENFVHNKTKYDMFLHSESPGSSGAVEGTEKANIRQRFDLCIILFRMDEPQKFNEVHNWVEWVSKRGKKVPIVLGGVSLSPGEEEEEGEHEEDLIESQYKLVEKSRWETLMKKKKEVVDYFAIEINDTASIGNSMSRCFQVLMKRKENFNDREKRAKKVFNNKDELIERIVSLEEHVAGFHDFVGAYFEGAHKELAVPKDLIGDGRLAEKKLAEMKKLCMKLKFEGSNLMEHWRIINYVYKRYMGKFSEQYRVVSLPKSFTKMFSSPVYIGQMNDMQKHHGVGKIQNGEKMKFFGEFKNGVKFGEGVEFENEKVKSMGQWTDGVLTYQHSIKLDEIDIEEKKRFGKLITPSLQRKLLKSIYDPDE